MATQFPRRAGTRPSPRRPSCRSPVPPMLRSLVVLIAFVSTGCAYGRFGTLAARRTITPNAEVIDVYGVGALLQPLGVDGGFTFGWRHATYIYPRFRADGANEGVHWTFGWVPKRG